MIYLDNAATTRDKPREVSHAMLAFMKDIGANPGRSGHRLSVEAGRVLYTCREALAGLLGLDDPMGVAFCSNATEALNLAVFGLLKEGDHVITTSMEHNSLMRPLRYLESECGVDITVIRVSPRGEIDLDEVSSAIRPATRMIAANHVSNVTGCILPISEMGRIAKDHGILMLADAAQSAGAIPVDMKTYNIDLLAVTGHKSLMGPMGTGALLIGPRARAEGLKPLKRGGTGSRSEYESQPDFLPDVFESGTPNAAGIAGLLAGIDWIIKKGVKDIRKAEKNMMRILIDGLEAVPGLRIYRAGSLDMQGGAVSFTLDNMSPSDAGLALDEDFDILARVGLHCAPAAHKTIGTFPDGTVRFSIGAFTSKTEILKAVEAASKLASRKGASNA